MNITNKKLLINEIKEKGLVIKNDNSGGLMEQNEFKKLEIIVMCAEDIEISIKDLSVQIEKSTVASSVLSKKIVWLNWILAIATVVIAASSIITLYLEYLK